jgi:hypothetical protein
LVGGGVFVILFFVIFFRPSLPILDLLIFLGFLPRLPLPAHLTPMYPADEPGGSPRRRGGANHPTGFPQPCPRRASRQSVSTHPRPTDVDA